MTWLITGGAGYIGSHIARALEALNYKVVVIDDLSTGVKSRLSDSVDFVKASILDYATVLRTMQNFDVSGVIHLAGKKSVEDSYKDASIYFDTNVNGTVIVRDAAIEANVNKLIFSSTAAVYDSQSGNKNMNENSPLGPLSPYGVSKLEAEKKLLEVGVDTKFRALIFRYFNVVGHLEDSLQEKNAKNLVPIIERSIQNMGILPVYGTEYLTRDGTCIRDYINVKDICSAHINAIESFDEITKAGNLVLNLGTGNGHSVLEVIEQIELRIGKKVKWNKFPPREGDSAYVVCDSSKAQEILSWRPMQNPFLY